MAVAGVSGRNKFRGLARLIDEDPARRRRVEILGNAYGILLDLANSEGSYGEAVRILERWSQDSTSAELLELETSLRLIIDSAHDIPHDPDDVGEDLAWVLDLENLLGVWADYRELEERSVSGEELRDRLDVGRERLERMRGAGELVGVWVPYEQSYRYPNWQLDTATGEPLPELYELSRLAAEVGMDEMSLDGFMTNPEAGEGRPPEAVYRRGPEGRGLVFGWLAAARSGGS